MRAPCETTTAWAAIELAHYRHLRSGERLLSFGAPLTRLDAGKLWVRRTLEDLTRGEAVQLWWWERTRPREQALVLVGGDEKRQVSVRFRERQLRACAVDPEARAKVTRRLIDAIEQVGANPSETQGS